MAELDTLKSYLVSLGFAVDVASYRKMNQLLDQQKKMVMNSTGMMSNAYVQAGKTIAAVLIGVGAATVTLMDKVAKADLEYDLFGMKMYMSADAAKKVKIAVDALGYSMDEIAWNPELKKRFDQLIELQGGLQGKLGADYKQSMKEIRDIRFEFTKMKVEGEYMMQIFVYELFKRMGISAKDVHEVLKKFNDWLIANMVPAMKKLADWLAMAFETIKTEGIPILTILWDSLQMVIPSILELLNDLAKIGKSAGSAAGDFKKFIEQMAVGDEQVKFIDWLGTVSYVMSGLANAAIFVVRSIILLARALHAAGSGNLRDIPEIWKDAVEAWKDYNNAIDLGERGNKKLQESADKAAGKRRPNRGAGGSWDSVGASGSWGPTASSSSRQPSNIMEAARMVSQRTGLPAEWIYGQWYHETGGFTNRGATQLNNLAGLKNKQGDYMSFASVGDFANYFAAYIPRKYGKQGVLESRTPEEYAAALKRGGYYEDDFENYSRGIRRGMTQYSGDANRVATSSITIGDVNVNVTGGANATASDIGKQTAIELQKKMEDLDRRRRAREIRELGGVMG